MKTETKIVYIADDGTRFSDENECKKYENSAALAYKTMLEGVFTPINGSFSRDSSDFNLFNRTIDDIFDDGRRECSYFTFKPRKGEDVKNFIAMLQAEVASVRGYKDVKYDGDFPDPFTQLNQLKCGYDYIVIVYEESNFYHIIEAEQFSNNIKEIIEKALE